MNIISYSDVYYENYTLLLELEGMTDDALIDECNHILVGMDDCQMDDVMAEYFKNGSLSEKSRKRAMDLYCLAYSELVWEE